LAKSAVRGAAGPAALISRGGPIAWRAWPRFAAPSVFARILDDARGGFFATHPDAPFTTPRRYVDDTNVLETTFTCDSGVAKLLDLMPVMREEEKARHLTPFRQLLRRIEVVAGEVPIIVTYEPRPNYGRVVPRLERRRDCVT